LSKPTVAGQRGKDFRSIVPGETCEHGNGKSKQGDGCDSGEHRRFSFRSR
jgi:hypothetical protein